MTDLKLLIFDLDMCLFDTDTQRPTVVAAIENLLGMFEVPDHVRIPALAELRKHASPISIAHEHDFMPAVRRAILQTYRGIPMAPTARTYGDEHHLDAIPIEKVLVTAGLPEVQHRKVDHVGIRKLFTEVHVDEIREDGSHDGKQLIFEDLIAARGIAPWQVVVLGDNPHAELAAGRNIGAHTVQTVRPGIVRWPFADHHISSLAELPELVGKIGERLEEFA